MLLPLLASAQVEDVAPDSLVSNDSILIDSITVALDSASAVPTDSLAPKIKVSESGLDAKVDYTCVDSLRFKVKSQRVYMYGKGEVNYKDINLKAGYIELDMGKSTINAEGFPDTTGKIIDKPIFKDGDESFSAERLKYNFKSQKGLITDALTQQGDGYIEGSLVKKDADDVLYIKDGTYCPCEDPKAGTYLKSSKLKIIKDDKIVSGPAYLVVEDIPTPLALPFGIFPNQKGQASGIVIPQYGNSPGLGFFLREGGFYWGINEYADATFTADIYSRGSWGLNGASTYNRLYKYNGNLALQYSTMKFGDPEFPDYRETRNFFINWNHNQDPKARPNSTFSANVNAGTSGNFRDNFASSNQQYLQNTFQSGINYNYSVPNKPMSLRLSANHSQNTTDSSVYVSLPNAAFMVQRFFPFKRKEMLGAEKWYEKIGFSYTGEFRNEVRTKQDLLLSQQSLDAMRNGIKHEIPVSMNMRVLKYFTLNPTARYTEFWYVESLEKSWDNESNSVINDTLSSFSRFGQFNLSSDLATRVYGMYNINTKNVQAVRHVATPSVGFSFVPDYSRERYGLYKEIQVDSAGNVGLYTPFENALFGRPNGSPSGLVNFNLQNNLEMKSKSRKDTSGTWNKVQLLDAFNFSSSYNVFADSLQWSPLNFTARTTILGKFNLQYNSTFDPYAYDETLFRSIDKFQYDVNGQLFRNTSSSFTFGMNLQSKTQKKKWSPLVPQEEIIYSNMPWRVNINYNYSIIKPGNTPTIVSAVMFNGSLDLTQRWEVTFNSGYDFRNAQMTYTQISVFRDLNCWEMRFSVIPFGTRKSYTFGINVKPAMLKDLKLERQRQWFDYTQ